MTGTDILWLSEAGRPFALVVVVEAQGFSARRAGARALLDGEGQVIARWVGGGCAESNGAIEACACGTQQIVAVDLDSEVLGAGMPCGGRKRIYLEPVLLRPVFGGLWRGRASECLDHRGALLGVAVVVMARTARFPKASRVIAGDRDYATGTLTADVVVVVATQHGGDHGALRRLLSSEIGYIPLISSRKRSGQVRPVCARPAWIVRCSIGSTLRPASLSARARARKSGCRSSRRSCSSAATVPAGKRRCRRRLCQRHVPSRCAPGRE